MMSSMLIDAALSDIPLFGKDKQAIAPIIQNVLQCRPPDHDPVSDEEALGVEVKELYTDVSTTAEKLRGIRRYLKERSLERRASYDQQPQSDAEELSESLMGLSITSFGQVSNRQLHEKLLALTQGAKGLPKEAQAVLDHTMLLRAKERYLFDCAENREVVADDPWLQDLWDWIAGLLPTYPHSLA